MPHNVIVTGSTGMVGKGVVLECLDHPAISKVLVINRRSIKLSHDKLEEIILPDFANLESVRDQLSDYDACFHCMGVSSVGMNEEQYTAITFGLTKLLADVLHELNPDMTFNYVTGTGTDSTESSGQMWRRVKGRTENYILNKGFGKAFMFRPGLILTEKNIESATALYRISYKILKPFYPLLKRLSSVTTTTKVGMAMIASMTTDSDRGHLENADINELAAELDQ